MSVKVLSSEPGTCSVMSVCILQSQEHQTASRGLKNCYSVLTEKAQRFSQVTEKHLLALGSRLAGCPVLTPSSPWVESLQVLISSFSRVKAMPPPGKVPRKENLGLQCEWGSCSFVCSAMEEFCEHVTQHLQQHLQGSGEEEEEEEDLLGKEAGHRKRKEFKGWWKI